MSPAQNQATVPVQRAMGCLVASVQVDLNDRVIQQLADNLLEALRVQSARGVILDLSGVSIMDAEEFAALRKIERMAALMGAATVFAGLRPGVVSALIDLDADVSKLAASRSLDDAVLLIDAGEYDETDAEISTESNDAE
ncbi:MAG: STAS domain-containing protein [Halieaceae bacterium]